MGVKGLSTFLRENRSLCTTVHFDHVATKDGVRQSIVVDSWGVIYRLYQDSLPWTSGGEYLAFYRLVKRLVLALRSVGFEPIFVLDGPTPESKHLTALERLDDKVAVSRLFFSTSANARSGPSYSRTDTILPPFASHAFLHALHQLQATVQIVPIGEADGECVVIAEQREAYILGQDSDLVIFPSESSRRKGYVPLEHVMWIDKPKANPIHEDQPCSPPSQDQGFTPVTSTRHIRESNLLPPEHLRNPTLVLTVYPPGALAARFRFPMDGVMPLFAALCGNDYTPKNASLHLFEPYLPASKRIEKVARVMREELLSLKKSRATGDALGDMVKNIVKKLNTGCIQFGTPEECLTLVDGIINATIEYGEAVHQKYCCDLYPFCGAASHTTEDKTIPSGPAQYAQLRSRYNLGNIASACLHPDRIYLCSILENPSRRSLRAGGLNAVRKLAYEIVDEALGLKFTKFKEVDTDGSVSASKDGNPRTPDSAASQVGEYDEVNIDLSSPQGDSDSGETSETTLIASSESAWSDLPVSVPTITMDRIVVEYVRSSGHYIASPVVLADITPPVTPRIALPVQDRLGIYLAALQSATPSIIALPPALQPLAAIIRFCIIEADVQVRSPWRVPEIQAVLRSAIGTYSVWKREYRGDCPTKLEELVEYPNLTTPNTEIVALFQSVAVDSSFLATALLLEPGTMSSSGGGGLTHMIPFVFFSGSSFHLHLTSRQPAGWRWTSDDQASFTLLYEAITSGVEQHILGWTSHSPARDHKSIPSPTVSPSTPSGAVLESAPRVKKGGPRGRREKDKPKKGVSSGFGRFDILEGMID